MVPDWTKPRAPRRAARPSWIGGVCPRAPSAAPAPPAAEEPVAAPVVASIAPTSSTGRVVTSISILPVASLRPDPSERIVELEAALDGARAEVARLARELAAVRARILEESEPELVRLAVAIAERVVGRELAADPPPWERWIEEGIAALPGRRDPVVAVAPDVRTALGGEARVVVDAALAPGTCEVREGTSSVEIGARVRLAALSDVLGVDRV